MSTKGLDKRSEISPGDNVAPVTPPAQDSADIKRPIIIPTEYKASVADIWTFLEDPATLSSTEPWPCADALYLRDYLYPPQDPEAGCIPREFAYLLTKDLRNLKLANRTDRIAFYISPTALSRYHTTWIAILHSYLVFFTNCNRPRTRKASRTQCILDNIEGYDIYREDATPYEEPESSTEVTSTLEINAQSQVAPMDLQKSISSMSNLFPEQTRLTGEETEPFTVKLTPIIEQMDALKIPTMHRSSVLFSLTNGKAREAASKMPLASTSLDQLVTGIKNVVLYDHNIQDRKVSRWNSVLYADFRKKEDLDEPATRKCIDYLKDHQKDLPSHMSDPRILLQRLKSIFRFVPWCHYLFQHSTAGQTADSFSHDLITAAASEDLRKKTTPHPTTMQPYIAQEVGAPSTQTNPTSLPADFNLAAFFAKTPPPPRHRRPMRLQRRQWQRNPPFRRRFGSRAPPAIRTHRRVCYGCGQEGHFIRDCPNKSRHIRRFTHLVDLGTAVTFMLEHLEEENSEDLEQVFHFIEDAGADQMTDEDSVEFDEWICNMLEAHDAAGRYSDVGNTTTFHVKMSIAHLQAALHEMMHSIFTVNKHLLIDTGAPKSICSADWLKQANWIPQKTIALPDHIPPFRFAGHPVPALHCACLISIVRDLKGHPFYFRKVVFILPPTPIPFLAGLQDQRRLGFDICLREQNDSHLKITAWNSMMPLVVNSHIWLGFEPCNDDPDPKFDWTPLIDKALDPAAHGTHAFFHVVDQPLTDFAESAHMIASRDQRDDIHHSVPGLHRTDGLPSILQPSTQTLRVTSSTAETKDGPDRPTTHLSSTAVTPADLYPVPPWKAEGWNSKLNPAIVPRLQACLKHPEQSAMLQLYRQYSANSRLPHALKAAVSNLQCNDCAANAQLPRLPKLALPPDAAPNISALRDVMARLNNNRVMYTNAVLDDTHMMMRLK